MKEIIVRLADHVADYIKKDAEEKGITSEESIRHLVGAWVQHGKGCGMSGIGINLSDAMSSIMNNYKNEYLKAKARDGALSCKNCTMRLTENDIDAGKCSACDATLDKAIGGGE